MDSPLQPTNPAIVIAAGGHGARMGGAKPARLLAGRQIIAHVADWALRHSDAVAIAAQSEDAVPDLGLSVLCDRTPDFGPIAALQSAFGFAETLRRSHVMLVACDMPFLPNTLIEQLCQGIDRSGAAIPICDGQPHNLAALWKVSPQDLNTFIDTGGRSLWRYAAQVGVTHVEWNGPCDAFFNINTPQDLEIAEAKYSLGSHWA